MNIQQGFLKFILGWLVCFLIRLIPFRAPNIEPVMATQMPFAKAYGWPGGFSFGFLSIVVFDLVVGKFGSWTWITAATYGLVGIGAYWFLKNRKPSPANFMAYGVIGTLVYDAITGLSIGTIFFGQPFMNALTGQIPFTLMHLGGNLVFSAILSPSLHKWVITNERLEWGFIKQKIISWARA
jgi:hypothetical protein